MVWPLTSTTTTSDAIFAHFPGVAGSIAEKGFEGWVLIDSFHWGGGLGMSSSRWRDDDEEGEEEEGEADENDFTRPGEVTNPSLSEIALTKCPAPESAAILFNMIARKPYEKISIRFVRKATGSTTYIPYMGYDTYNTLLSALSTSCEINATPRESLSLNFMAIEFLIYDAQGEPTEAVRYHLRTLTATLRKGANLEVVEVVKKEKKAKDVEKNKEELGT
ncbi:hypothetical protein FIBSPDRAFT_932691 [Athelia psychrophila]|uniref:Uncharacterized protein n=1 Tax=Athelia psychrophila TaxID=1759441 RepID=A0A166IFQ2_9AGAM|nr:hypothetical protein FIBSPDRAFT_932691 [Fibularhizoctonia sp. CBS 109695]